MQPIIINFVKNNGGGREGGLKSFFPYTIREAY